MNLKKNLLLHPTIYFFSHFCFCPTLIFSFFLSSLVFFSKICSILRFANLCYDCFLCSYNASCRYDEYVLLDTCILFVCKFIAHHPLLIGELLFLFFFSLLRVCESSRRCCFGKCWLLRLLLIYSLCLLPFIPLSKSDFWFFHF